MQTLITFINKYKPYLYFIGLAIMAIGLPVSEFLMSISIFVLAGAWLFNGPKKSQWQAFKNNKIAWITFLIFFIDIIGLLNTSDFDYARSDLRIKLPLLLVPVFIAPAKFSKKEITAILAVFVGSTLVGTFICFFNYQINLKENLFNIRDISIFISHIRFGLMINIAIIILGYYAILLKNKLSIVLGFSAIWLIYFLVFLGSINGFIIFSFSIIISFFVLIYKSPFPRFGIVLGVLLIVIAGYVSIVSLRSYKSYFVPKKVAYNDPDNILKKTKDGHKLVSNKNSNQLQNGHYVRRNINVEEIKEEWGKRAHDKYFKYDIKNQKITGTLVRYLASKGLPKNAEGIAALSDQDITNIELGYIDYRRENWNNLELRVDQFFFQLHSMVEQKNPGGKPFVQRIFYLKASFFIIKNNFFAGVGTGDIQIAFEDYYQDVHTNMPTQYWVRTHNQYLTYFITNGILGFLFFIYATTYPLVRFIKTSFILALSQFILLFSFLSEDTLESQPGVTLYIFIIALGIIIGNASDKSTETSNPLSATED
jgi:hypothetical protein